MTQLIYGKSGSGSAPPTFDVTDGLVLALHTKNDTGNTPNLTRINYKSGYSPKLWNNNGDNYIVPYPNGLKSQEITIFTRVNVGNNVNQYPRIFSNAKYDYTISPWKYFGSWELAMNWDNSTLNLYTHRDDSQVLIGSCALNVVQSATYLIAAKINGLNISLKNFTTSQKATATMSEYMNFNGSYQDITVGYQNVPPYTANSYLSNGNIDFVYAWNKIISEADLYKIAYLD